MGKVVMDVSSSKSTADEFSVVVRNDCGVLR